MMRIGQLRVILTSPWDSICKPYMPHELWTGKYSAVSQGGHLNIYTVYTCVTKNA